MSHMVYYCELPWECKILPTGDDCAMCHNLDFAERVADVYRPHRRAIKQSMATHKIRGVGYGYTKVVLHVRLGCPDARAWVRRRKRLANGAFLGRWSWSRRPRGVKLSQLSFPAWLALAVRLWSLPETIIDEPGDLPGRYLGTGVI